MSKRKRSCVTLDCRLFKHIDRPLVGPETLLNIVKLDLEITTSCNSNPRELKQTRLFEVSRNIATLCKALNNPVVYCLNHVLKMSGLL